MAERSAPAAEGPASEGLGSSAKCVSTVLLGPKEEEPSSRDLFALQYPMWVMPLQALLALDDLPGHQDLKSKGTVVEFVTNAMVAIFVSHQWVGLSHPDPEMRQFRVLQGALRNVLVGDVKVQGDRIHQAMTRSLLRMTEQQVRDIRAAHLWYDWFSCPQIRERSANQEVPPDLQAAVDSIPAYIHLSSFFVILAPSVAHADLPSEVCDYRSWGSRGWCRMELFAWVAEEGKPPAVLIAGVRKVYFTSLLGWLENMPGRGAFTVEDDRRRVLKVTQDLLDQKLLRLRSREDLHDWRFFQAMRGSILSSSGACAGWDGVGEFMADFQLELDGGACQVGPGHGWTPLHYAAIAGGAVVEQLVGLRCEVNRRIPQPYLPGLVRGGSCPLQMAAFFGQEPSIRALLRLRADPRLSGDTGGTALQAHAARRDADSGLAADIVAARADVNQACNWPVSMTALHFAAMLGSAGMVAVLLDMAADPGATAMGGNALFISCCYSTADSVVLLLQRRMDPNFQWDTRGTSRWFLCAAARWACKMGASSSSIVETLALSDGSTPLMQAARGGNAQAVRLLLAARADAGARTSDGRTAASVAAAHEHDEIERLLQEAVASSAATCAGAGAAAAVACWPPPCAQRCDADAGPAAAAPQPAHSEEEEVEVRLGKRSLKVSL